MPREHSMLDQLKSQLQIDRNIMGDDSINAMPDSGNVDAFAKRLVSAAEPTNLSLKALAGPGTEGDVDGVVTMPNDDDEDEFNGNDNNRRVAERIAREQAAMRKDSKATAKRQKAAQEAPSDEVIGTQREMDREANENNANVDLGQVAGSQEAGGVLGHAEGGEQMTVAGKPGQTVKPAEPTSDERGAAKGGKWKPQG